MNKDETITELCKLMRQVGEMYDYDYAHDCICGENPPRVPGRETIDYPIIEFMRNAVESAIEKRNAELTCPHCGYKRTVNDHKSWCEEHNVCICPQCGLCPQADGVVLTDRERMEAIALKAIRDAFDHI